MVQASERILTTHVGSLPRPPALLAAIAEAEAGAPVDEQAFAALLRQAVGDVVRKQVELGIDIIADGEYGKPSFVSYVNERLAGFEPDDKAPPRSSWAHSREADAFPEFYAETLAARPQRRMVCTAPVRYRGMAQLGRDIANLKTALAAAHPRPSRPPLSPGQAQGGEGMLGARAVFMPAISPASAADWQRNAYYKSDEEYLFGIADALREEYEAIVAAGFLLQVDDPQLVTHWIKQPQLTLAEYRRWAEGRVEALNHALRNIPPEKVRHHTCYGINMGPRIHDVELKHIVDIVLRINAGAYSFEAANPRHEHEWRVWQTVKLPDGKALIPGVISHSTVLVEHPELVAERIGRYAAIVGRERVIAGADCGFASFAGSNEVHPTIVWAKLKSLAEGARLATEQL